MTPIQETFLDVLAKELSNLNVSPREISFSEASRKDQVFNVSEKWTLSFCLDSVRLTPWHMEFHIGEYKGSPQYYLNVSDDSDWAFFASHGGEANGQIQPLIARGLHQFIQPHLSQRSLSEEALQTSTACSLPIGFKVRIPESERCDLEIYEAMTGEVVVRYMFRDYVLYRSHFDDIFFEERKWYFESVHSHNIGTYRRQDITPRQWAQLVSAWMSRDFFYNFGHLVNNDEQFKSWGKELVSLPRDFPWKFRSEWEFGLTNWVTMREVKLKTANREKWSPKNEEADS